MSKQVPLKAGLVGLAQDGRALLDALSDVGALQLVAVSGTKAAELADRLGVTAYDDPRSLVVEQELDVLLAAAPAFATGDTLSAAAKRGLPVWRWPPLGRSVEAAAGVLKTFEDARCPLVVGHAWDTQPMREFLAAHASQIGMPTLWQINCLRNDPRHDTWQGDRERAGGGALLHEGLDAIRLIVSINGLPNRVSCATLRHPGPATQQTYDTEDIAVAAMYYGTDGIASIVTSRTHPIEANTLVMESPTASAVLDGDSMTIQLADGPSHSIVVPDRMTALRRQIERFAEAVATGEPRTAATSEILAAHAVVEAAYLSARTGDAESPSRFLDLAGPVP